MKYTKYETSLKHNKYLFKFDSHAFDTPLANTENNLIIIYPEIEYQSILGFGAAFTEAAGFCFSKLPEDKQNDFIEDYFSEAGNNYSLCRAHIGSCDFCLNTYSCSYNESLSDFSIERDKKYLLPLMKKAYATNNSIHLVATPWSPPAFMKDNNNLKNGGKLLDKYKLLWAEYLVKYIQAYQKEGITIDYMTIQNEPNAAQPWESCQYTAQEEQDLVRNYIFPIFKANNISVKLLIWDHNKERIVYRANDSAISDLVAGIGYHYYSGDHFDNIKAFSKLYPDKLIIHTEGCTGYERLWYKKLQRRIPNAEIYAHDIIGDLNAGANGYIDWNMLLDYKGGPTHVNNSCNAPIMLNKHSTDYIKTLSYYYIGHFSRFIHPGAKRVEHSSFTSDLEITSFKNPNSSIAVVILNRHKQSQYFNLCINRTICSDTITGHSIITYVFE